MQTKPLHRCLAAIAAAIDTVRWRWAKSRLADIRPSRDAVAVPADKRFRQALADRPRLAPYQRLAGLWHEHSLKGRPRYEQFLPALGRRFRVPLDDVLDLACGTGTLAAALAPHCRRVVGVDCHPLMVAAARKHCEAYANVSIAEGDFHTLELGETFDVVISAFDSLNYLDHIDRLRDVLQTVARHLRAGGFFVFDALGTRSMRALARLDVHFPGYEPRHAMCSEFDDRTNRSRTLVVFPEGVEEHLRLPIDPPQLIAAADDAGLTLLEAFDDRRRIRTFYVLRKPLTVALSLR